MTSCQHELRIYMRCTTCGRIEWSERYKPSAKQSKKGDKK